MTALCIRSRISPPRAPNSSLIDSSSPLEYPPRTSMMILCCRISYPGNCCLSSQRRGPYLVIFSSCFFPLFSVHEQLISTARTFFFSRPLYFASLAQLLQRMGYPNIFGPRVTHRWVWERPKNTTVAMYQRAEALYAFPRTVL